MNAPQMRQGQTQPAQQQTTVTTTSFEAGFVFYYSVGTEDHACVVISRTQADEVVVVTLTTYRSGKDGTCVFGRGDHECVKQPTCVSYVHARTVPTATLQRQIDRGDVIPMRPVTKEMLARIQSGAGKSPHTPNRIKTMLATQGIIDLY